MFRIQLAWPDVPPQWHHWRRWYSYQYSCSVLYVYFYSHAYLYSYSDSCSVLNLHLPPYLNLYSDSDGDTHSDQYADQRAYRHYRCVSYLCIYFYSYSHSYLLGYRHCLHDHLL